jgi:NAD(P)-dependent dehydrogenase (short-subunit alcohol dehydrogenase family)
MDETHKLRAYAVTGGTSGIGLAIVEALLARGMKVMAVARSPKRCAAQQERLRREYPQGQVDFCVADLAIQPQVRKAAQEIEGWLAEGNMAGLDGLVNNAGTFVFWQTMTPEGFDTQWAVNHLAPFLLTLELLPLLQRARDPRVVTVSSGSHYGASLNWNDIQLLGGYNPLRAYKQSKLANVLFTAELNRRLGPDSPIRAVAADPGLVNTHIGEKSKSRLARWVWSLRRRGGAQPEKAAAGVVQLLFDPAVRESPDIYWKYGKPKAPNPYALNPDHARRLWDISAQMTGVDGGGIGNAGQT